MGTPVYPVIFSRIDIPASQTGYALRLAGDLPSLFILPRPCRLIGLTAYCDPPRSAGTLTMRVRLNGQDTALQAAIDAANPSKVVVQWPKGAHVSAEASDELGVVVDTTADWLPSGTPDLNVVVWVAGGESLG